MATSDSSVHSFMEMAAGLLLGDRVGVAVREELIAIAARSGLHEAEMDEVVLQLAEQGIVSLDDSFIKTEMRAAASTSAESVKAESLDVKPVSELRLPDTAAQASVEAPAEPATVVKDPLARDMFKQRVVAELRSDRELTPDDCRRLLEEADGFGVEEGAAKPMLRRWLTLAKRDADALMAPLQDKSIADNPPPPMPVPASQDSSSGSAPPPLPPPMPSSIPPPLPASGVVGDEPAAPPVAPPIARTAATGSSGEQEITFISEESEEDGGIEFVEADSAQGPIDRSLAPPVPADPTPPTTPAAPAAITAPASPPVSSPPPVQTSNGDSSQRTPGESYVRYLQKAIPQLGRDHISVRSEERLIAQGAEKLGIGEPYALELLRQVATELGTPMLSQQSIEEDPRFDAFRERAASILAEHRGVNIKSRMMLSAVGQELGLGEEELDQAMLQLTGGANAELDEAKQASFRTRLVETLRSMRDSFITSPIETAILDDGVDYEGLSYEVAKQILHTEAAAASVVVIDKRHAKRHIIGMLSQNSAQGEPVDLAPLLEEARLWGLSDDEFMEIVAAQRLEKSKQQRRERRITAIALAGSCVTAAAVLWGVIWLMWPPAKTGDAAQADPPAAPATLADTPAAEPEETNPWSDPELLISLTNARKATPLDRQEIVQGAVSEDPERRMLSIKSLVADLPSATDDRIRRESLLQLFKHWFRVETAEDNSQQLMLELLARLPGVGDQLPQKVETYESDLQLVADVVEVMSQDTLADERREWVGAQLADKLETVVDLTRGWVEVERHCKAELAVLLYRNLITAVKTADGPFEPHHWALSVHLVSLVRPVDPARAEKLQLDFLDATLRAGKESWMPYEELIRRFAYSKDVVTVLRMTKLMEDTSNESLQRMLSNLLLLNIGEVSKGQSAAEVAAMVRSHFQGSNKPQTSERTLRFMSDAEAKIARFAAAVGTDAISQQIIDLARLSTLGYAARIGGRGAEPFDAMVVREPKLGVSTRSSTPVGALAWQRGLNDAMSKQIQLLSREKRVPQRMAIFQGIGSTALSARRGTRTPTYEPEPRFARMIAAYMLSPKTSKEHDQVMSLAGNLAGWSNVLLAMVDEVEKLDSREAQVEEVVRTMVPALTVGPGDPWKTTLQHALLQTALDNLQTTTSSSGRSTVTLTATHLSTYYQTQALLRGVTEQQMATADGPGKILQLMVRKLHQELLGADIKSPEDKRWVEGLEPRLIATENAAVNDIQRLAMMQRLWLRLLRIELTMAAPSAGQRALLIEEELIPLDRKAASVWEQLRDGELQLLKLWVLYNQEAGS